MDSDLYLSETGRLSVSDVSDTHKLQESVMDNNSKWLLESSNGIIPQWLQECDSNIHCLQECDKSIDIHELKESENDSYTCGLQMSDSDSITNCHDSNTNCLLEPDSESNTNHLHKSDSKPHWLQECDNSNIHELKESDNDVHKIQKVNSVAHDEDSSAGISFFPALYIQRYSLALNYLRKHNIKSVIDFGCSECGFMTLLPTVSSLEQIALVDVDRDLLAKRKSAVNPELHHYVFRRSKPLHVALLAGSAEDTDSRLLGYEAVTLIEVIEHLYPKILENVTHNVFGNLSPKLCVVTTPNAEFNVLFENDDPKQFRHWDHKFEWTREEFHEWCDRICQAYGYCVEYSGVGYCPYKPNSDHLGPCSQTAVFTLLEENISTKPKQATSNCYELIAEADFPYKENVMSVEEKVDLEVSYYLRQMFARRRDELSPDESMLITVSSLAELSTLRALCDESGLRASLERSNYRLSADGICVILDDNDEVEDDLIDEEDDDERDRLELDSDLKLWRPAVRCTGSEDAGRSHYDNGIILSEENWDTEPG